MVKLKRILSCVITAGFSLAAAATPPSTPLASVQVGTFEQEVARSFHVEDGLPDNDVAAIAMTKDGAVYAGTAKGLARFADGKWIAVDGLTGGRIAAVSALDQIVLALFQGALYRVDGAQATRLCGLPSEVAGGGAMCSLTVASENVQYLSTSTAVYMRNGKQGFKLLPLCGAALGRSLLQVAVGPDQNIVIGAQNGLLAATKEQTVTLTPQAGDRSWAPHAVRGVAFDKHGGRGLWFAGPQGVGRFDGAWKLYTGQDGLPYNDFTWVAAGEHPEVAWFGTRIGAIRFDGVNWEYRQGRRWLPDDEVRAIAVADNGDAWFATKNGVGVIARRPMTFAEKAKFYEDEIDKYNRRTPYGFVMACLVTKPGDKSQHTNIDSDNDGLWTSMYGAGECFAYAATGAPEAKQRAKNAFEALRFLGVVTQGGTPPARPGFIARSILPTSGSDPNAGNYAGEQDRAEQKNDAYAKLLLPRWPKSADGQWYWKADTSSDELDGHYFFYATYYDLVADTEAEKERVRQVVVATTDHLIEHGFNLVDFDGKTTRWAVFNPESLNYDKNWISERGLNSLTILSYLSVAEHMTGNPKYRKAADKLINKHAYAKNQLYPRYVRTPGGGNQSDDEMALMCYYNLLKYETDPELHQLYALSCSEYCRLEEPEANPFFNFIGAALCARQTYTDAFGTYPLGPLDNAWLGDAVETLKRFPLDRFNWAHKNSHRIDLVRVPRTAMGFDELKLPADGSPAKLPNFDRLGYRVNGKVLPVDERFFEFWNSSPWELDYGGDGKELADGAVFLLPYYMGLYHGFIVEK